MNALVPERAMVPSASTNSSRLMPMPLSSTASSRLSASIAMRDARLRIVGEEGGRGDGLVAQPLAGVGGVGDELAEEDVLVGIDRVHHQVQQPRDVGFEDAAFRLGIGGRGSRVGHGRQVRSPAVERARRWRESIESSRPWMRSRLRRRAAFQVQPRPMPQHIERKDKISVCAVSHFTVLHRGIRVPALRNK